MKQRKGWLSLAVAPFALAMFAFAQPAQAADYNGTCANLSQQFDGQGNVTISESGSCTLNQAVTASGWIRITAGGAIDAQALTSQNDEVNLTGSGAITLTGPVTTRRNTKLKGSSVTATTISSQWGIQVEATSGTLSLGDVTSNSNGTEFGTNIMLTATGNIGVGNVKNNGTSTTAGIEIRANTGGANVPFKVGGGGTNGSGTLSISSATGGGTDPYYMPGGIYVNSGPVGGITVSSMSNLVVTSSGSRSGVLILDAQGGTLTLPTGVLSSDGTGSQGAGLVSLMAQTITTVNGTIISASQTTSGYQHGVNIAASTINLAGATGLKVKADGNGISDSSGSAYVTIVPKDGVTVAFTGDVNSRNWQINYVIFFQKTGAVTINGATSLLTVSANGDYSRVSMSAYPFTFNNKTVTVQARGTVDHIVQIGYSGAYTNTTGLAFLGTGVVSIDANATTGAGGGVSLFGDKFTFNAPTFNINANGPTTGNGDGGTVYVGSSQLTISPTSKVTVTANAASAAGATGNAILGDISNGSAPKAIQFYPGPVNLDIGTAASVGQVSFAAKGGTAGGNGGTIVISSNPVNLKTANAVNASALAGLGNGGEIFFYSYIQSVDPAATVTAIGKGAGTGGKFTGYSGLAALAGDVNKYVKVDGGTTVGANFHGSISLNGITCQQRKTTSASVWPKTYWNCVHTGNAAETAIDKAIGDVIVTKLSSTARTPIGTRVYVYEFADFTALQNFFSQTFADQVAGATFPATGTTPNIYAAVTAPANRTEPPMRELTIHEIGHAFDIFYSRESNNAGDYNKYVANDFLSLDYIQVDPTSEPKSVKRLPCADTPIPGQPGNFFPDSPPFANVPAVCSGTVLNSAFVGLPNRTIIRNASVAEYFLTQTNSNWAELYAQSLAYQAYAGTSGQSFAYIAIDNIFKNGNYLCVRNWAESVRAGTLPRPLLPACTAAVPSWYSF